MINLSQILNNQTWHVLKRDFQVVINTRCNDRKLVEQAKLEVGKRLQKYKHRDKNFKLSYPNSRMISYIDVVIDSKDDKEYLAIIFKIKLNIVKGLEL